MACLPWFVSLQLYENSPPVLLSSPSPCGVISPHSTVSIPLALETQVIGAHRSIVYISVFGSQEAPLVSQFSESHQGHMLPTIEAFSFFLGGVRRYRVSFGFYSYKALCFHSAEVKHVCYIT